MTTANNTAKFTTVINGKEENITNAMMMKVAIEAMKKAGVDAAFIGKAEAHLATLNKKQPGKVSEVAMANAADAQKLLAIMPDEPFTLAWVADKMGYVSPTTGKANTQKAYKVIEILMKAGKVVKVATKSSESAKYQMI